MVRAALVVAFAFGAFGSVAYADAPPGVVSGMVTYESADPPSLPDQKRDSDPKCPQHAADDSIVVNHGKLAGAIVRISNGTMGKHDAPKEPVVLDQHGCSYVPHVVGLVAGQKLVVKNSDNTFHNVWGTLAGKELLNKPQGPGAADVQIDPSTAKAGDVIELKCGVHPWMHAYAVVQDHPYFVVTGENGAFEIKGLEQGTYTLESWHPVLGSKSMKVVIGKGARGKVTARLSYKP
jgi:hypothetical protein